MVNSMVFGYTPYPNAAKEYLRFMMEEEQYGPYLEACIGYWNHPLQAYEKHPIWTADPKHEPYATVIRDSLWDGYKGTLGEASAAVLADFVVVQMVAAVCSGQLTPEEAAAEAERRAQRYYEILTLGWAVGLSRPAATSGATVENQPAPATSAGGGRAGGRIVATVAETTYRRARQNGFLRLLDNRRVLVFLFMLPAAGLLLLFLTYPLGLGVWLGFTDTRIGRSGFFIGWENYESLFQDRVFWTAVQFTIIYTFFATIGKFALGLWLALLLNHQLPFKAFIRSIILVPWIVPTVLSAIAFWWIYDPQFSIISYSLQRLGLIDRYIDFLGVPNNARASLDRRQHLARHPVRRDLPARRTADHLAEPVRGGDDRRRQRLAAVLARHPADADADPRRGADLLGAVHVHRLPAGVRDHPRRPGQLHPPHGHAGVPARDPGRAARRGVGDRGRDDPVFGVRHVLQLLRPGAAQVAAGRRQ